MPRFELKCKTCYKEQEFLKVRSDDEPTCDLCNAKGMDQFTKLISRGTSHILKGTGWARDNYAGKKDK